MSFNNKGAIFIMPRKSSAWSGSEALWITVAGWAMATENDLGYAIVVTPDRIAKPKEVLDYPILSKQVTQKIKKTGKSLFIPDLLKIFIKDLYSWCKNSNWNILNKIETGKENIQFVWQQHDLFPGPGRKYADKLNVPLIMYVHAPVVWEASKWGVNRYAWGNLLERIESRSLKEADCVAVVSEEVKKKVIEMGVTKEKVLISPMAVSPDLFSVDQLRTDALREKFGLRDKFVVGWAGSFRKFHALDVLIKSFAGFSAEYPEARLLLIGEGALKNQMEELVQKLEIESKVIFYGKVKFSKMPEMISIFDIAVVGAPKTRKFHYSPLKLREYMAAGKAVIAPRVGEIPKEFEADQLMLYEVGDISSLSTAMAFLRNNFEERERVAVAGYKAVIQKSTWNKEVAKALAFLKVRA